MKSLIACTACLSIAVVFCVWQAAAEDQRKPAKADPSATSTKTKVKEKKTVIGRHVPNFIRPNSAGKMVALSDFGHAKLVVVIFMGTECPIGNAYVPDLVALQQRYPDKQVQVIGINSVLSDSAETVARHMKEFKVDFPVLIDNDQIIADRFGAQRTPEIFVLDTQRKIRYRGRIDDRFGYIYKREESRRQELEEALKELLAGKDVSVPETEPVGCLITRKKRLAETGKITFAKNVSSILLDRCANCHHPGTTAPFSLLTYEDARNWSEMIKETIVQRRMPPWNADPRYGHFSNDLRMTDKEIDTVVAWIDNGSPMGEKKDLPTPRQFADGWTIGTPDLVIKMPREFTVQATGTVKYQYFVTPTNFKEDMWIQAAGRLIGSVCRAWRRVVGDSSRFRVRLRRDYQPCGCVASLSPDFSRLPTPLEPNRNARGCGLRRRLRKAIC